MSLWVCVPLFPAALDLLLIFLVLRSDWRDPLHRVVSLFLLALAIWAFSVFGLRAVPTLEEALTWQRVGLAIGPIGAVLYYHFTVLLTRPASSTASRRLTIAGYVLVFLFMFLVPTDILMEGNQMKFYGPAPILTKAFSIYIALVYFFVMMGVLNLWRTARRSSSHQERNRAAYIILGTICFLLGGLSDFLPVIGLNIYPMGVIGNLLFCLFVTIAILRHQLLDIRLVFRRGLAYGIVSALVIGAYVGIIFLVTLLFGIEEVSPWANITVILLLAVALQPVLRRVQRMVDRLFYRERYGYLEALERFTRETQSVANLQGLSTALMKAVALAMQATNAYLLLSSTQTDDFVLHSSASDDAPPAGSIPANSAFLTWMSRNDGILRSNDLDILPAFRALRASERDFLAKLGGDIYMPLKTPGGLTGVLVLAPRASQEPYSNEDIAMLWTLTRQAAMSIENARLYAEERERVATLSTLERMKPEFLISASHQLKTPLTSVRGAADILMEKEEKEPSPSRRPMIETLSLGVDSLQRLVNEVLDFAKMQTATLEIHREPSDVAQLLRDVVVMMTPALQRRKQHLELELPDDLPQAMFDRQRLEQVLVNLLENASKFSPKNGHITVRAFEDTQTAVVVAVQDTGPGIPEEEQQKIFEPYYQASDTSGYYVGSGLGLAIAKSLVELHEGEIWLTSKVGDGSIFYFSVPLADTLAVRERDGVTSPT